MQGHSRASSTSTEHLSCLQVLIAKTHFIRVQTQPQIRPRIIAEVLAVVASGAALASLVIRLTDVIDWLRKRCEDLEKLCDSIGVLIKDLEINRLQLEDLESDHKEISEFITGPIVITDVKSAVNRLSKG